MLESLQCSDYKLKKKKELSSSNFNFNFLPSSTVLNPTTPSVYQSQASLLKLVSKPIFLLSNLTGKIVSFSGSIPFLHIFLCLFFS